MKFFLLAVAAVALTYLLTGGEFTLPTRGG